MTRVWATTVVLVVLLVLDFLANLLSATHPSVQSHSWDATASVAAVIWIAALVSDRWKDH